MEEKDCLSRLQKLCSKAEYCEADVYKKALKYMDSDAEAAARITRSLVEERYVDDLRYAGAYVREKANIQGWGPVKIRFQLRAKGVNDAVIGVPNRAEKAALIPHMVIIFTFPSFNLNSLPRL